MRHFLSSLIFISFLIINAYATPFYFGVGLENIVPQNEFKNMNKQSIGIALQIQNRTFCNLWYGVRVDYSKLDSLENVLVGTNVFDKYFALSPEIRYVWLLSERHSYDDSFYLFANALLSLSSITRRQNTDESNWGLGGLLGVGIGFGFQLLKLCWILEMNGLYGSPNFIFKDNLRPTLTAFNFSLVLGVRL
ncbi:MAG: hypothetical protein ACUVQ1_02370 [Candidatus Kapaibacteriales bacterium]